MNHFDSGSASSAAANPFPFQMYQMAGAVPMASQFRQQQPQPQPQPQADSRAATPSQSSGGLVLSNLPQGWGQREVQSLIFGDAADVKIHMKDGYCVVDCKDAEAAEQVAKKLDNYTVHGTTLSARVQAKQQDSRPISPNPQQQQQQQPYAANAPQGMVYAQGHFTHPQQSQAAQAPVATFNPATGTYQYQVPVVPNRTMLLPMAQQAPQNRGSPSDVPAPIADGNPASPRKNNRRKKGKKSRPSVFVGGIRTDISERELRNFFGMYGKINHVTIKEGYAFLDFADDASAHTAVEKCNGYVYDGKPLGVRIQDEGNRRTAQEAKKQGQNVSMVFKRLEEGQPMPAPMQQAPMQMQQQQQQQGMPVRQQMMPPVMAVDARPAVMSP